MVKINKPNWEDIARNLLQQEKLLEKNNYPKPIRVMVKWRNRTYIGHIQEASPEYCREIVALSKSSKPLHDGLTEAIRKLDSKRLHLEADDFLDLEGRQHILRRVDSKLTNMTPEQTEYITRNPPMIYEL